MAYWYIVTYQIGSIYRTVGICANDKEQASKIAQIQIRATRGKNANVKIITVREEHEPLPYKTA
jgi:hypothetical protein